MVVPEGSDPVRGPLAAAWCRALSVPSVEVSGGGPASDEVVAVLAEQGLDGRGPAVDVGPVDLTFELHPGGPVSGLAAVRRASDEVRVAVDRQLRDRGLRVSFANARSEFVLDPTVTFLNHGSFGATPRAVLEARQAESLRFEAQPVDYVRSVLPDAMRGAAARVAAFLGVAADELGFVDNATSGVAAVLRSLDFAPGDVILTTDHTYAAVSRILDHVCSRTGARVHVVPVAFPSAGPEAIVEEVRAGFPDGVKLAVFDHVTSITGLVFPARELAALCRERGVPVLIDGAHAPGMLVLDVEAIGADFWTGNLHKWAFAPKGCAVLHVRRAWHDRIHPLTISHGYGAGMVAEFDFQGTRDYSTFLAAEAGLAFAERWGWDRVRAHNHGLRRDATALLNERLGLTDPDVPGLLAGLRTFRFARGGAADCEAWSARLLREHRMEVMFASFRGEVCFRISPQLHNHLEQYEALASALASGLAA